MGRYRVDWKAFISGEWYTKSETDNRGGAFSSAKVMSDGRASRIFDSEESRYIYEQEEDQSHGDYIREKNRKN